MHQLAKAAIDGDEAALEMFEYRPKSSKGKTKNKMDTKNIFMGSAEALCFILADAKGSVYYINENQRLFKFFEMEASVARLLYNQENSTLISITDNQMLGQYIFKSESEFKHVMTVRFLFKGV